MYNSSSSASVTMLSCWANMMFSSTHRISQYASSQAASDISSTLFWISSSESTVALKYLISRASISAWMDSILGFTVSTGSVASVGFSTSVLGSASGASVSWAGASVSSVAGASVTSVGASVSAAWGSVGASVSVVSVGSSRVWASTTVSGVSVSSAKEGMGTMDRTITKTRTRDRHRFRLL